MPFCVSGESAVPQDWDLLLIFGGGAPVPWIQNLREVTLMKSCFGGENPWSGFLVLLLSLAAALACLAVLWRFDLATSPAWQVVIYHGMLALLLSATFIVASFPPLCLGQRLRWFLVGLALLVPVVVFFAGWILTGFYSGFRDDRIFDLVVVSVSGFMLIWTFITFPLVGFLFVRDLVRLRRRGVLGNDGSS